MSYTPSSSAAVSHNPYSSLPNPVGFLPVPLVCETTYLVMQNFGGTNNVSVKLDKQLFNHPDFFHKLGCFPYTSQNTPAPTGFAATHLDGSSYLLNHDDIEAHLSIKAQGIFNACGTDTKSVTFHYVAHWMQSSENATASLKAETANKERVVETSAFSGAPEAFTQMIVCNPPAIITGTHMTTQTDVLVQNALIGFFAIPPLNTSEVKAFTATYIFTPLPKK